MSLIVTAPTLAEKLEKHRALVKMYVNEVEKKISPGIVIMTHMHGEEYSLCEGQLQYVSKNKPASVTTQYDAASITKFFTTVCALILVEKGKLLLDDLVIKYLPDSYKGKFKELVTVRDLMTCAIRPKEANDLRFVIKRGNARAELILDVIRKGDLEFEPGSVYDYNNYSAITLGFVLEAIVGKKLPAIFDELIINKIGLKNTTFCPKDLKKVAPTEFSRWRGLIHGSIHDEQAWVLSKELNLKVGSAGLFTTAEDLMLFGKALLEEGILLNSISLKELFEYRVDRKPNHKKESFYGLGIDRVPDNYICNCFSKKTIFMNAFQTSVFLINLERKLVFVQMSNSIYPKRNTSVGELRHLRRLILRDLVPCKHCQD